MEFIEFGKCQEFHGRKLSKQVAGRYGVLTPLCADDVLDSIQPVATAVSDV